MQVAEDETSRLEEERIQQSKILALPYREIIEEYVQEEPVQEEQPVETDKPIKKPKQERKRERDEFLKAVGGKDFRPQQQEEKPLMQADTHSDYDGKLIFQWMRIDFDRIRNKISYCETPQISAYPEENMRIKRTVNMYKQVGVFNDGNKVKNYIESLMWYGKVNPELFGADNYILNETIQGYKEIYDDLMKLENCGEGDEALVLLGKLILVASRPLVIDETLMKQTEYEPSSSEGGVYGGEYNQEEDGM